MKQMQDRFAAAVTALKRLKEHGEISEEDYQAIMKQVIAQLVRQRLDTMLRGLSGKINEATLSAFILALEKDFESIEPKSRGEKK